MFDRMQCNAAKIILHKRLCKMCRCNALGHAAGDALADAQDLLHLVAHAEVQQPVLRRVVQRLVDLQGAYIILEQLDRVSSDCSTV